MTQANDVSSGGTRQGVSRGIRCMAWAVSLTAAVALAGCSGAPAFEAELKSAVAESGDADFDLASLDAVKGTDFLVVCPYESTSSVERRLGFDWADAPDYSESDDRQAVVIVDGERVAAHAELARDEVDFCADNSWELLPVDTALAVARTSDAAVVSVAD
jgi:hypothetical protein